MNKLARRILQLRIRTFDTENIGLCRCPHFDFRVTNTVDDVSTERRRLYQAEDEPLESKCWVHSFHSTRIQLNHLLKKFLLIAIVDSRNSRNSNMD